MVEYPDGIIGVLKNCTACACSGLECIDLAVSSGRGVTVNTDLITCSPLYKGAVKGSLCVVVVQNRDGKGSIVSGCGDLNLVKLFVAGNEGDSGYGYCKDT